ncbi:hypothetical protein [Paraburkholderia ginsengiterrae]|uniref:hypothetical protein n=1 Tax=Paraburkholderia ginsengiterrae TaxID=1462993 RepID=UPI0014288D6F|nr:hypothetical protein [Paraburkholderia ginsengiterrae]
MNVRRKAQANGCTWPDSVRWPSGRVSHTSVCSAISSATTADKQLPPPVILLSHADFAEQNSGEVSTEFGNPHLSLGSGFLFGGLSSMPFARLVGLTITRCGLK